MSKADPQSEIRAAFKERRIRLGMRQKDMALALGVDRMTYHRLEGGKYATHLSPETRDKLHVLLTKLEEKMDRQIKWR